MSEVRAQLLGPSQMGARAAPSTMYSWLLTETIARSATSYIPPGKSHRQIVAIEESGVALASGVVVATGVGLWASAVAPSVAKIAKAHGLTR